MNLTKEVRVELKAKNKTDSDRLFSAIWRRIKAFGRCSEIHNIDGLYDDICSELVNNPKSKFYMWG